MRTEVAGLDEDYRTEFRAEEEEVVLIHELAHSVAAIVLMPKANARCRESVIEAITWRK